MISILMLAYNDEDYIKYCLDSIYDFADEIIIIEGLWEETNKRVQDKTALRHKIIFPDEFYYKYIMPRSSDSTIDIIKNYPDYNKKIKLIFENEKTKKAQKNKYWEHTEAKTEDWLFTVSPDEIYEQRGLNEVKKHIDYFDRMTSYRLLNMYEKYSSHTFYEAKLFCIKEPKIFYNSPDIPDFAYKNKVIDIKGLGFINKSWIRSKERQIFKCFYYDSKKIESMTDTMMEAIK